MIQLWGTDACTPCKQAKMLLDKHRIPYQWVDVRFINFNGIIPRLILEDGREIEGLPEINKYLRGRK